MKHKERSAFMCYHEDWEVAAKCLDDTQLGQLIRALVQFSLEGEGEEPALSERALPLYLMLCNKISRDADRYEETCEKRRSSAAKRYRKEEDDEEQESKLQKHANASKCMQKLPKETVTPTETENENETEKEEETEKEKAREKVRENIADAAFAAPTPEQVTEYALSLGKTVDSQRFCDYYSARGWMLRDTPIRDWQAVVRMWIRDDEQRQHQHPYEYPYKGASPLRKQPRQVSAQMYTQRQYTEEDLAFGVRELLRESEEIKDDV